MTAKPRKKGPHELIGFLAIWAAQYQHDMGLNGLHPIHYDLMKKYGARMDAFKRATAVGDRPGGAAGAPLS